MPDESDTPNKPQDPDLVALVQGYHKSIQEEFDVIEAGDIEQIIQQIRRKINAKALHLINGMLDLADDADSEAVRLKAQTTLLQMGLGDFKPGEGNDPIARLIKELTKAEESPS